MRIRVKLEGAATYHVMSRIVERMHRMDDVERERFRGMMRKAEAFSGVKILTYALLANHFHILVHVPERQEVSEEEVIRRCRVLYGATLADQMVRQWETWREDGQAVLAQRQIDALRARMYDVSEFMKTLKMRYARAYNASHGRVDPLWTGRFKSVLVEGRGAALGVMAAYIDLNPVRAGLVADPKEYRWSGYGEACVGQKPAIEGLRWIAAHSGTGNEDPEKYLETYRMRLYVAGEAKHGMNGETVTRAGFSRAQVEEVLKRGGRLGLADILRCHVRYFHDGMAIGGREFVESVFRTFRHTHFGPARKTGARNMRGSDWGGEKIFSARDLRLDVIRPPD